MPAIIRIPEPCHADWNQMTPTERGRHCAQCAKTVVDFTDWQPTEILFYLKLNAGTCGRFRQDQLDVPVPSPEDFVRHIVHSPLAFLKKIAAIFLFVFGLMSCSNEKKPVGAIAVTPVELNAVKVVDSIMVPVVPGTIAPVSNFHNEGVLGEPAIAQPMEHPVVGGAPIFVEAPHIDSSMLRPKPLPEPYEDSL